MRHQTTHVSVLPITWEFRDYKDIKGENMWQLKGDRKTWVVFERPNY